MEKLNYYNNRLIELKNEYLFNKSYLEINFKYLSKDNIKMIRLNMHTINRYRHIIRNKIKKMKED